MKLHDYLNSFRNNCFIWRREPWYQLHIHLINVFKYLVVAMLLYRSSIGKMEFQIFHLAAVAMDLSHYPGITITYTILMKKIDDLDKFIMENFEDYASRGEEIHQKILKISKYFNWMAHLSIFLGVLNVVAVIYSESKHNTYFYIFPLLGSFDMRPIFYWTLLVIYFLYYTHMVRITYSGMNLFLYFIFQYILQYILLKESARSLQKYSRNDESYHKTIKMELKRLIVHSQRLTRYHAKLLNLSRVPMSMLGFLMLASVLMAHFMITFAQHPEQLVLIAVLCVLLLSIISIYFIIAQSYINQTTELWDELLKCPWYEWNTENKKSYYILLTFYGERENILYMGLLPSRYESLIVLGRSLASAITFLSAVGDNYFG